MFPQPSPNSQALYNSLQSGGATPGTLDFHRTAMTARAHSQQNNNFNMPNPTSQSQQNPNIQPDLDSKPYNPNAPQQQQENQDPFSSHQTNDAANGLFMLAQAGGQQQQQRNGQQNFGMPPQQQAQQNYHGMQQDQNVDNRAAKNSVGSNMSGDTENGPGDYSDVGSETKPQARTARGKKGSAGKGAANGKRKTDETPSKPNNKRQRTSTSMGSAMDMEMDDEEDNDDGAMVDTHPDGKKMTDEEKQRTSWSATVLLHSNVVSAKSNGWPTSSKKSKSSQQRTMRSRQRSPSSERKLSVSRPCCSPTRTALCRQPRASALKPSSRLLAPMVATSTTTLTE